PARAGCRRPARRARSRRDGRRRLGRGARPRRRGAESANPGRGSRRLSWRGHNGGAARLAPAHADRRRRPIDGRFAAGSKRSRALRRPPARTARSLHQGRSARGSPGLACRRGGGMADNGLNPRLELRGVTKQFPGVLANDDVSLTVKPGEIHALLGENGAGKSTLVKMIYGILAPDSGEIRWDGTPVRIANPRAARKLGIGMVFQHFSLFEALTVLENIALGLDANIAQKKLEAEILRVLALYGLTLDPHRIVSTLSV